MSADNQSYPPKWASRFLHWYCKHSLLEEIEGDINEEFNSTFKNRGRKKAANGFFQRRADRNQRIRKKYQKQQSLLNALAELNLLSKEDQYLFKSIAQAYSAFYRVRTNRKLSGLIKKEGDAFIAISKNKEKALKKICRGYWVGIFR